MPSRAVGVSCAALKWDDWPASAEDYDLYLTRSPGGAVVVRIDRPADRARAAQRARLPLQHVAGHADVRDRHPRPARHRPARALRPLRLPGPEPRAPGRRGQHHGARHVSVRPDRRRRVLAGQQSRDLQLRGPDHRRSRQAGPRRPRLGLVLHLRPVRGLRQQRIRRNVCRDAARRRRGRARQGGEPRLRPGRVAGLPRGQRRRPRRDRQGLGFRKRAVAARRRTATRSARMCRSGGPRASPRASRATGSGVPAAASARSDGRACAAAPAAWRSSALGPERTWRPSGAST